MNKALVVFSHGLESGPRGKKIRHLEQVARSLGHLCMSPDFQGMTQAHERVVHLVHRVKQCVTSQGLEQMPIVLVGSSMGGFVSLYASQRIERVCALFLMAPAVGLHKPAYEHPEFAMKYPTPGCEHVTVVHGVQDDVVPVANALAQTQINGGHLKLVDDGHRLDNSHDVLAIEFEALLRRALG